MLDALRRKRCESLDRKGRDRIREGEFDEALDIAAQLESLRYSGAFEIAALAHVGRGELESAVSVLRRGVAVAPDVWLDWQLLGNCLSDLKRYDEAQAAYERALACPGSSPDSVGLNQAVLAGRRDRPSAALTLLDTLQDPALAAPAREVRISALQDLERLDEALALAEAALEGGPPEDAEGAARWDRIAAKAGRIRLALNLDTADVRRWAVRSLRLASSGGALLRLLRELTPLSSLAARRFELIVQGAIPLRSPLRKQAAGYFVTYQVTAETPERGLELIRELEESEDPRDSANLSIDSAKDLGPGPGEPIGVTWRSGGRAFYERED